MNCNRSGCDKPMCDIYIDGIGYVCYDCESDFREYLEKNEISANTESEFKEELKKFMALEKDSVCDGKIITVHEFFDAHRK